MYYCTGSGRIELNITLADAQNCSHSGQCDDDVKELLAKSYIKRQLRKIDDDELSAELKEYGSWSAEELADRGDNEMRFVWLACCNIAEEHAMRPEPKKNRSGKHHKNDFVNGHPIRCYDNGGKTADRYTVVYMDMPERNGGFDARGMNSEPFHPQGIGMGVTAMPGWHLGKRIAFADLPADCQKLVKSDLTAFVDHKNGVREVFDADEYVRFMDRSAPDQKVEVAECGSCNRMWDDAKVSGVTPAPAALCPFCNV